MYLSQIEGYDVVIDQDFHWQILVNIIICKVVQKESDRDRFSRMSRCAAAIRGLLAVK